VHLRLFDWSVDAVACVCAWRGVDTHAQTTMTTFAEHMRTAATELRATANVIESLSSASLNDSAKLRLLTSVQNSVRVLDLLVSGTRGLVADAVFVPGAVADAVFVPPPPDNDDDDDARTVRSSKANW